MAQGSCAPSPAPGVVCRGGAPSSRRVFSTFDRWYPARMRSKDAGTAGPLFVVLGMALTFGCGQDASPPPPPAAPPPVEAVPPPPPAPIVVSVHIAKFGDDRLLTCMDITLSALPGEEPDGGMPDATALREELAPSGNTAGMRAIPRPCREQFGDRVEWASCSVSGARRSGGSASFVDRYYDFGRAFDDDTFMQECLEMNGEWTAVPRTSPEWQHAQRERQVARDAPS